MLFLYALGLRPKPFWLKAALCAALAEMPMPFWLMLRGGGARAHARSHAHASPWGSSRRREESIFIIGEWRRVLGSARPHLAASGDGKGGRKEVGGDGGQIVVIRRAREGGAGSAARGAVPVRRGLWWDAVAAAVGGGDVRVGAGHMAICA